MEIVLTVLLTVLIVFIAGVLILKMRGAGNEKIHLESILNEKFSNFSKDIRETMESSRKEVQDSKDVISKHALKTLEHITSMNKTVSNLVSQQEKAQELGKSLEYLLQAPKLRGNYGETILEEMLERILPRGIWERQYAIDENERVDAVVKYRDVVVPIDSKFPKDDYQKYLAAKSSDEKKTHWSNYERALKVQINSIRDKYIKPEKGTTEFALLFIPSESIYYETIAEKNHLGDPCQINEYAISQKVIPVSPNTFYAFLNVVMLGIRNLEITRDARKLQGALSRVEKDFDFFYKNYEAIGKTLEKASKAYEVGDRHVRRFKNNLESTLALELEENVGEEDKIIESETTGQAIGDE